MADAAPAAIVAPGSEAWHAKRLLGIGSSESPCLLGLAGFEDSTPMRVYFAKVRPPADLAARRSNAAFRRGHRMEPLLAEDFADEVADRGWTITTCDPQVDAKGDPMVASPDRLVLDESGDIVALLELKTAGSRDGWGDPEVEPDSVPPGYMLQVQHQLAVGVEWRGQRVYPPRAFLYAAVGHLDDRRRYVLERSERIETAIRSACRDFWQRHVVPRVPPEFDGSESGDRLLALLYPESRPPLRSLPSTHPAVEWVREYIEKHGQLRELELALATLEQRIKAEIGSAEGVDTPYGKVTWRQSKDATRTDYQAVCGDMQRALLEVLSTADADRIAAQALQRNTYTTKGSRVFLGPWSRKKPTHGSKP